MLQPAVKYHGRPIPDTPGEPPGGEERVVGRPPRHIPFHAVDPQEAVEQLRMLHKAGLRLHHLQLLSPMPQQPGYQLPQLGAPPSLQASFQCHSCNHRGCRIVFIYEKL